MEKLAAISVDLDELDCYLRIHGLDEADRRRPRDAVTELSPSANPIYDIAIDRLAGLFVDEHIPATFFVIGNSLQRAENQQRIRELYHNGFEIGNHTFHHRYDFVRQSKDAIAADVAEASRRIAEVTSHEPVGFRAPGYTITDEVFEVLRDLRFQYDSSVFPCPLYYGAKAAAIGAYRLTGRTSHSIVDTPSVLAAPTQPYHTGVPYWRKGHGMLELPIGVTPARTGRLPFIGTSLAMLGPTKARWLTRAMASSSFVNVELHGIDLLDEHDIGLDALVKHQPDLRTSVQRKLATFRTVIEELRSRDFHFVTLSQAATVYARAT
jgi:hypothetical protein